MINFFAKFDVRFFAIKNDVFARILIQFEAYHEILREINFIFTQASGASSEELKEVMEQRKNEGGGLPGGGMLNAAGGMLGGLFGRGGGY